MKWQQVAMIVWLAVDVVTGVIYDGKLMKRNAIGAIIGAVLLATILYTGGFWNR